MKHRWRDYDDGFDGIALHEGEDFVAPAIWRKRVVERKKRLRAAASAEHESPRDKFEDETQRQRIARVKAWGVPY